MKLLFLALFCLSLFGCQPTWAEIDSATAVNCIMGEARGESLEGMTAVAEVLRKRKSTKCPPPAQNQKIYLLIMKH